MPEAHGLTLYHLLATGGGGLLGTLAVVWRLWVVPAQQREIALQVRLAKMDSRLDSGDRRFDAHSQKDDAILAKLDRIEERLRNLETAFAGVAPALTQER